MRLNPDQFAKAAKSLNAYGGMSVKATTGSVPTKGWFVARKSDSDLEPIEVGQANAGHIASFAERHAGAVRNEGHIGAWTDTVTGAGEIEPSKRYPETHGGFQQAASDMHTHNQEAIYHASSGNMYHNLSRPGRSVGEVFDEPGSSGMTKGAENRLTNMAQARHELRASHPKTARQVFGPRRQREP